MNTQVIDLTSEESSSTQRLTSFEASTEAAEGAGQAAEQAAAVAEAHAASNAPWWRRYAFSNRQNSGNPPGKCLCAIYK